MLQSLFLKLIFLLESESGYGLGNNFKKGEKDFLMEKAIRFIDENFVYPLSLEEIAREVSLSPVYFHNRFRNATGRTPHAYVLEKRIKKAENLLATANFSISQVAYECGFSSQSYFTYAFKKAKGLSPREYIRQLNAEYVPKDND